MGAIGILWKPPEVEAAPAVSRETLELALK